MLSLLALLSIAQLDCHPAIAGPEQKREVDANCKRIDALYKGNHKREAVTAIQNLICKSPTEIAYLHLQIPILVEKHDYRAAKSAVDECLRQNPDDLAGHFWRSAILIETRQYKQARIELNKSLERLPHASQLYTLKSKLDFDEGKYQSSCSNADLAIKYDPRNSNAWSNRAVALVELNQTQQAAVAMLQACLLDGQTPTMRNNLARVLMDINKPKEALAELNVVIKQKPDWSIAYINRSQAYLMLGKYNEALTDSNRAIALDPVHLPGFYTLRASIYWRMKKYSEAIADARKALSIDKNFGPGYYIIGQCHYMQHHYKEAIENCTQALRCSPQLALAFKTRGLSYKQIGEDKKARADLERCNAMKQTAGTYAVLANMSVKEGCYEQALDDLSAMPPDKAPLKQVPHNADYKKILALYEKMLKTNPNNNELYFERGLTYFAADKTDLACEDLEQYIKRLGGKGKTIIPATTWLILGYRKLKQEDKVRQLLEILEKSHSPALRSPELLYLRGMLNAQKLLAANNNDDARTFVETVIGLNLLYTGKPKEGIPHLKLVQMLGKTNIDAYAIATIELTRCEKSGGKAAQPTK